MRIVQALIVSLALLGVTPAPLPSPAQFSAPGADEVMDLHGDPQGAGLVIFAAGNQWFVMPQLLAAFQRAYPDVGPIFYETLPPGVLSAQIASGALQVGELTLHVRGDVVMTVPAKMAQLQSASLAGAQTPYARNVIAILVGRGNPLKIASLADLGRPEVRVAMPNPKTEGIATQIEAAYRKAGGDALDHTIMVAKVAAGTTIITSIHHRETPAWLLGGKVDAGPVWLSEATYQEHLGNGLMAITVPPDQNDGETYVAAQLAGAPHAKAAAEYLAFLRSPAAQAIYRSYGFAAADM